MKFDGIYESLINASIRFVSFRPRSEHELRAYIDRKLKKEHTTVNAVIEQVVVRMRDLGYLDDRKFARWWVEQRQSFKPKGNRLLQMELRAKGIPQDVITDVLSAPVDGETVAEHQLAGALVALEKKISVWRAYPSDVKQKKAYDFLRRRGFDTMTISRVVDAILGKVVK
jgi:regulatory protein